DWPILNNIINKSLNDISKQEREEIIHKWIHIEPMSLFANKVFWRIVVIMLMIGFAYIVIFILWNMSLKKKVKQRTKELEEDIAKRIVIEKALSKSEENFKMIVENQVDLLVKVDENGRFIFVSPSYCKMFGKSKEELIGKSFTPLVHPEDLEKTQIEMKNLYSRPYTCYIEQRAKTQFGWRWLAWKDKAVLDANGKVKEIIGLGRDITDRKEAELENLKLAEIIRYMKDGIILTDPEGKIEFVNSAFEEMSGYKLADIMFMDPIEFVVTDNPKKQAAKIRSSMKKIESWSGEMICRRANGEEYFIETQIFPIFDENNRLDSIAAIQRDITEKKEIEAKLNAQQEKLENAVMKRTAELRNKNKELEEMNKIFVGREFRIKKLKEKLKELEEKVKILD
ncbi:MAG: PAS domain S-box protein, partial [Candidatus Cloacimonetes bacterium]|nr:PAS domain S-box protein [Candidatus Cloacimonadota bacterium]MCF7815367.1 PAS domain S-box protein [Candidatus Cloacimonadota bacterium]